MGRARTPDRRTTSAGGCTRCPPRTPRPIRRARDPPAGSGTPRRRGRESVVTRKRRRNRHSIASRRIIRRMPSGRRSWSTATPSRPSCLVARRYPCPGNSRRAPPGCRSIAFLNSTSRSASSASAGLPHYQDQSTPTRSHKRRTDIPGYSANAASIAACRSPTESRPRLFLARRPRGGAAPRSAPARPPSPLAPRCPRVASGRAPPRPAPRTRGAPQEQALGELVLPTRLPGTPRAPLGAAHHSARHVELELPAVRPSSHLPLLWL